VRIRVTRKLADALNGVDLRALTVGEIADLNPSHAEMLIAEGWAEIVSSDARSTADERSPRKGRPGHLR
jgi:hypothetical protein